MGEATAVLVGKGKASVWDFSYREEYGYRRALKT